MQETYLLKPIPLGPVSNSIQMAHTCKFFFPFLYSFGQRLHILMPVRSMFHPLKSRRAVVTIESKKHRSAASDSIPSRPDFRV